MKSLITMHTIYLKHWPCPVTTLRLHSIHNVISHYLIFLADYKIVYEGTAFEDCHWIK